MALFAGVSETNITPPPDVWMAGYAARKDRASGTHDELFARALAVDNGHQRLVLIAADLIALDGDLVDIVRNSLADEFHTPIESILLHCTHNHSGPVTRVFSDAAERDPLYIQILVRKLIGVARQALGQMRPAYLTYGESSVQIGVNRRRLNHEGKAAGGADIAGPIAPIVQTLCVNGSDGRMFAQLFSHACHPTTLRENNRLLSADWPGAAVTHLRSRFHAEAQDVGVEETALPIFLQGCCGDIDPIRGQGWDAVIENGSLVANAAHTARWNAHGRLDETLQSDEIEIELPVNRAASEDVSMLSPEAQRQETIPLRLQRLTLGGVHMLGFPAEMFVQYQIDFSRQSSAPVFSLSCTNGCKGYIPTRAEHAIGGYEVEEAPRYYGMRAYSPDCERIVRDAVYRLLGVEDPDTTPYPLIHGRGT